MAVDPARLSAIPLFADLTSDERAAVAAKLEERHVETGEHTKIDDALAARVPE